MSKSPTKTALGVKRPAQVAQPSVHLQVFANIEPKVYRAICRQILLEILWERFGTTFQKLPLVESGRLDVKKLTGSPGYVAGMGYLHKKGQYMKALGSAPGWLDQMPIYEARDCLNIAMACGCPLPKEVKDLFVLQGCSQ